MDETPRTRRDGDGDIEAAPAAPATATAERLARHEASLRARAVRELGRSRIDGAGASDYVHEAFVAVLEAEARGKGPAPSPAAEAKYLLTTLLNGIRQAIRRSQATKHGGGAAFTPVEGDEIAGPGTSPSARVRRATREECLEAAFGSLSPRDRDVLRLELIEEKPRSEIAAVLGVSERHVGNLYRDALSRLREAYLAHGGPWDLT
ncbi:RNA polymerase sigma factor [Aquisphaera giovannonii]|uniref:RNA polymerase sigma factor n=1 Tax=Aquisphaera giovannonii TaxID=406548 RepID=A0A5B9W2N8_9BACT|nr:sigma-70 family RNA polymerase sigma factor [Aquisphaera giovannonii]QEH34856.1 RNA polymerase sigma factor [Aquisphaera giovannonii]